MQNRHVLIIAVALSICLQQQLTTSAAAVPMRHRERQEVEDSQCGGLDEKWVDAVWSAYKDKFQRSYSSDEDAVRKQLFIKNVWMVAKHNVEKDLGLHTFEMGFNDFSDWTNEELSGLNGAWPDGDSRK